MIAFNAVLLNPHAGGISTYMFNIIRNFDGLVPPQNIRVYLAEDQGNNYPD